MLFVMAENLPKSAAVEWQLTWQTGVATSRAAVEDGSPDTDDEDDDAPASHAILSRASMQLVVLADSLDGSTGGSEWASSASAGSSGDTAGYYVCRPDRASTSPRLLADGSEDNAGSTSQFGKVLSVRAFHLPSISSAQGSSISQTDYLTDADSASSSALSLWYTERRDYDRHGEGRHALDGGMGDRLCRPWSKLSHRSPAALLRLVSLFTCPIRRTRRGSPGRNQSRPRAKPEY